MQADYWHKQTKDKLLFPDLEWSKPENKRHAGKLVIIGGNLHGFAAPATAFTEAEKAGIGSVSVVLPAAIQKIVGGFLPEALFVPSTPIGSFGSQSLAEMLDNTVWGDAVLLAGDVGRNSETAIVFEKLLESYVGPLTITQDVIDLFLQSPQIVLNRPETTLVLSFAQLQKLATKSQFTSAFTFDMGLVRFVDALHEFTTLHHVSIIVKYLEDIVVGVNGQVSTTRLSKDLPIWRVKTAAHASVWQLQHPAMAFKALTTSVANL